MATGKKIVTTSCPSCNSSYRVYEDLVGKKVSCKKCSASFRIVTTAHVDAALPPAEKEAEKRYPVSVDRHHLMETLCGGNCRQKGLQPVSFEDFLLTHGLISQGDFKYLVSAKKIWEARRLDICFGAIAVKNDFVPQEIVDTALSEQKKLFREKKQRRLLGDILIELGFMTEKQRDLILVKQKRLKAKPLSAETPPGEREVTEREAAPLDAAVPVSHPVEGPPEKEDTPPPPSGKQEAEPQGATDEKSEPSSDDKAPVEGPPEGAPRKETGPPSETPENEEPMEEMAKEGLRIVVSKDRMTARLKATGEVDENVTLEKVKALIEEMGICEGIVEDALIKGFINSEIFREKPFVVAKGYPGNPGRDSEIKYYFDVDHLKAGTDQSDGAIDFRDRGKIPHVKEGSLLAEKFPGVMTEHGMDLYGHAVIYPEAWDPPFESGPNTELSEDGLKIFAKTDGQPMTSFGGRVSVASELVIPGDVNFETGHIDFEGNIVVRGTIQEGFHVKGANLTAKEASGAEIDVAGDVTIVGGINSTSVKAGGNIKALFISNSSIESFGDLKVTKEILESTVNISGACVTTRGKIISSTIKAKLGIESMDIGTERSTPCKLSVGVDEHVELKVKELSDEISEKNQEIEKNREQIEALGAEDQTIQASIAQLAHTQDRSQLEIKTLNESLAEFEKEGKKDKIAETEKLVTEFQEKAKNAEEELNTLFDNQDANMEKTEAARAAITALEQEVKMLTAEKEAIVSWEKKLKGNSSVVALGRLFPGTVVSGAHCRRVIKDGLNNVRIREVLTGSAESGDEWEMRVIR